MHFILIKVSLQPQTSSHTHTRVRYIYFHVHIHIWGFALFPFQKDYESFSPSPIKFFRDLRSQYHRRKQAPRYEPHLKVDMGDG